MTAPPDLTDRTALLQHRTRARRAPALFLHELAADEIQERLAEVNRTFTAPAVVSGFPEVWEDRFPGARFVPDADHLSLEPAAHDLVIHALTLHWSNDPVGQLVQCRRALKPDGLFVGVLFGGRSLHELRAILAEVETALTGGLSPRVVPMAEIRDLGALLQRAGFALPVADAATQTVTYETLFHLMADLRAMGETNALTARHRRVPPRALFPEAARRYADAHAGPDGRIPATVEMIYLTGWAPSEIQPKALRPGSAQTRLAAALGTKEQGFSGRSGEQSD
ncbi:SAM-dependent methyltransferase, BioC-like [Rhodovulum sp. P5]|uniref:methyltransferase domain-containing protein n=1 Tax=Rhodovulum sp. P5 TaxID=1564506 RepID=UPI0009C3010B|nr:methyltransferase domain-containing protein [Rhodovulum sp. P5]ARE40649.1 SAM-dependent methyltransferase, BioC-like [Rhodovulum sp. P5]